MKRVLLLLFLMFFVIGCTKQIEEEPTKEVIPQDTPEVPKEVPKEATTATNTTEEKPEEKVLIETKTDWPTFHGNNARSGFSASKAPSKPNVLWKWVLGDFDKIGYDGSFDVNWPIIHGNKVFIAGENIFAFDLKTGKFLWTYQGGNNFYPRGLAAGNGKLFATVNNDDNLDTTSVGFVYALDESTGRFLWRYETEKGLSHSLPLFADNKLFVGDDSGNVYAISEGGSLIWKKYLGAKVIHSSPAFDNGVIFIGTEDNVGASANPSYLYALDAKTGEVKWKFKIDSVPGKLNLVHATPAISGGVVYFGAENGYFYALSSKDGSMIWKQKIASGSGELIGISAAAALGHGKVFIGTYEGKFLALDQKDGKTLWEYNFGKTNADSSPVLADNKVYFGASKGDFYCFNEATGKIVWKEKLGSPSAALADGILIVQNTLAEANMQLETPIFIAFSDEGKLSIS